MDPNETQRMGTETQENAEVCPVCGMDKASWPAQGVRKGGETYCCQGCAEGTGCTCDEQQQNVQPQQGQADQGSTQQQGAAVQSGKRK